MIDTYKDRFGVEPICRALEVAPSTYYDIEGRPACARELRDAELKIEIDRVFKENFEAYGADKLWRQLRLESIEVGRDRASRLMKDLGLAGVVRGKTTRTTIPAEVAARPGDLVDRKFTAPAPNRLWVACPSTSVTRRAHGSGVPTKTPTAFSDSTSREAPTSASTAPTTSPPWLRPLMDDPVRL